MVTGRIPTTSHIKLYYYYYYFADFSKSFCGLWINLTRYRYPAPLPPAFSGQFNPPPRPCGGCRIIRVNINVWHIIKNKFQLQSPGIQIAIQSVQWRRLVVDFDGHLHKQCVHPRHHNLLLCRWVQLGPDNVALPLLNWHEFYIEQNWYHNI